MDLFGALEIRIFLALAVVLGVAFVALVCDVLKRSNEQLRDVNTELRARMEERERIRKEMAASSAPTLQAAPPKPAAPALPEERSKRRRAARAPRRPAAREAAPPEPASAPAPEAPLPNAGMDTESQIQAGIHDRATFDALIESNAPLDGLALSLSVNESAAPSPSEMSHVVRHLLHEEDIAFHYSDYEFILLLQGETGAPGQRRLKQIGEWLWDYQFRSVGMYSILFSWGAAESRGESVAAAVAKAREDMEQTRRNRKMIPIDARRRRGA